MKNRRRFIPHLLIGILSLIGIVLLICTFSPTYIFGFANVKLPSIIIFFFLLFLTLGGIAIFILANIRRGITFSIFVICVLLLQYLHATNVFYVAILLVIVFLVEFLFWKKK